MGRGQNKMLLLLLLPHRMPQQPHKKLGRRGGRRGLGMQLQQPRRMLQQPLRMQQQPLRTQQQPHLKLGGQVGGRGHRMLLQQPVRLVAAAASCNRDPHQKATGQPPTPTRSFLMGVAVTGSWCSGSRSRSEDAAAAAARGAAAGSSWVQCCTLRMNSKERCWGAPVPGTDARSILL